MPAIRPATYSNSCAPWSAVEARSSTVLCSRLVVLVRTRYARARGPRVRPRAARCVPASRLRRSAIWIAHKRTAYSFYIYSYIHTVHAHFSPCMSDGACSTDSSSPEESVKESAVAGPAPAHSMKRGRRSRDDAVWQSYQRAHAVPASPSDHAKAPLESGLHLFLRAPYPNFVSSQPTATSPADHRGLHVTAAWNEGRIRKARPFSSGAETLAPVELSPTAPPLYLRPGRPRGAAAPLLRSGAPRRFCGGPPSGPPRVPVRGRPAAASAS